MSDVLELELQMVVTYYAGAGSGTWVQQEQQGFLTIKPPLQLLTLFFEEFFWAEEKAW